jgi:hypothetical protein
MRNVIIGLVLLSVLGCTDRTELAGTYSELVGTYYLDKATNGMEISFMDDGGIRIDDSNSRLTNEYMDGVWEIQDGKLCIKLSYDKSADKWNCGEFDLDGDVLTWTLENHPDRFIKQK